MGRHEPRRFMQHDCEWKIGMNEFAVHFYVIARARLRAKIGADSAVDCNATCGNQFVAFSPRTDPGTSKIAVKAQGP